MPSLSLDNLVQQNGINHNRNERHLKKATLPNVVRPIKYIVPPKATPITRDMLSLNAARKYVSEKAPSIDETMLVSNVDYCLERGNQFYYKISSLDYEIREALKFGYYKREP
jgi:hypothetical protein